MDEDLPAAFMGTSTRSQTMADGSLRITIDLSPKDAIGAFTAFGSPGSSVAIARLEDKVALEEMRPQAGKRQPLYGKLAKELKLSGFFRTPAVWEAIGTDDEYLAWVKRQPSAVTGVFSEYHDNGEGYSIPAHVRRVEHGAGTAIKPPYSAIPLTKNQHDDTHQHGDIEQAVRDIISTVQPVWPELTVKFVGEEKR